MATRVRLLLIVAAAFVAAAARAEVRIDLSTSVPDAQGKVTVDVVIDSDGESVGGFQNDIVFDHTVVRLESVNDCRINPAIGTTPLGTGSGVATCEENRTLGPCKTLHRNLAVCEGTPQPAGCPAEAPDYSRFRAIVAATAVPNDNAIPPGVAYTCTFTVVNAAALPLRLYNAGVVVSDPFGERLDAGGGDGGVCVDEEGGLACAPLRAIDERCTIDFECASGNCDRCCDHQFDGICAAPRTATPTASSTPTRTPFPSRTPSSTRTATATWTASFTPTATSTPTPKAIGDSCSFTTECAPNLACNRTDGDVCCTSLSCPQGMACNVPGFEGYCVRGTAPTPELSGVVLEIGSARPNPDGFAEIAISMRSDNSPIGGLQNDIVFDNTVVALDPADCVLVPAIGLFPDGLEAPSCLDDTSIGACKNLNKTIETCGGDPAPAICPQSAAPNLSVFRGIVAATAAPNDNSIPPGPIYTCRFKILDAARLPLALQNRNAVVSTPLGMRVEVSAISGRIEAPPAVPGSKGAVCFSSAECDSGDCVDGVCCLRSTCGAGESCAITGSRGDCAPLRLRGEGCDFGSDCETRNCDLHRDSAASIYRGACGVPREPQSVPGECVSGAECDAGGCVGGFCCDAGSCPAGQFCNTGQCAPPAEPGAPCTADEQCALGLCVDGACCVTADCGAGKSCNIPTRAGICHAPFRSGSPCSVDEQCPSGFCTDGACCEERSCPFRSRCNVFPDEGVCSPVNKPSAPSTNGAPEISIIDIGEDVVHADGTAVIPVVLASRVNVSTTRNDILFDNTIVQLDPEGCVINPKSSLFPPAAAPVSCFDDPTIGPCKELSGSVFTCGGDPQPDGCPPGVGSEISIFRGIVEAVQMPNSNPIPRNSVLYTCTFQVIDPTRLPTRLVSGVVAVDPFELFSGAWGFDGSICSGSGSDAACAVAEADGASCTSDVDCLPGLCNTDDDATMGFCVFPEEPPAGVPTGAVTPTATPASAPSASATVPAGGRDDTFSDVRDDGCNVASHRSKGAVPWALAVIGLVGLALRRLRDRRRRPLGVSSGWGDRLGRLAPGSARRRRLCSLGSRARE